MEEVIEKAHLALLEGNRDEVLRLLKDQVETAEVLWLQAHSTPTAEERLRLFGRVARFQDETYSPLAEKMLAREQDFDEQLSVPPPYQFWKKPAWKARFGKFGLEAVLAAVLLIVLVGVGIFMTASRRSSSQALLAAAAQQTQTSQALPTPTLVSTVKPSIPTAPAIPLEQRPSVQYPAGRLSVVRIENPTFRDVSFGYSSADSLATPAVGSSFAAVQVEFTCFLALCENPPEVQLLLVLDNGNIVSYPSGGQPVLVEQPALPRVAENQAVTGWYVFEVPSASRPTRLLVKTGEQDTMLPVELPR